MKKYILLSALMSFTAAVLLCSPSMAIFPKPDYYQLYTMRQGYNAGQEVWFISTTTNSIKLASSTFWGQLWNPYFAYPPLLSAKLTSALDPTPKVARPLYLVTNISQGPVFDSIPGADDYSGLWQVLLVTWKDGFSRKITNTDAASDLNPLGLPPPEQADIAETDIVVDLPIIAVGKLGGPWQSAPPDGYRIKQALDYDPASIQKWILLPHYYVYANNSVTKKSLMADVLITECDDENTAYLLGANYAPGLSTMPNTDVQDFWVFNPPTSPSQWPVLQEAPSTTTLNSNVDYSPVMRLTYLDRNIPAYVTVSNKYLLENLLTNGGLAPGDVFLINANAEVALW